MENQNVKKLNIYIDESGAPSTSDKDPFYIGVFVSTKKISTDFFDQALQNLKNDAEFKSNKTDQTTYERGYFHSSLDSKNGHSYSCRAIADISWPCEFYVSCIDKNYMSQRDRDDLNTEGKIHQHTLMISQMEFLNDRWDQLEIYIAEREGSFTSNNKEQWEKEFVSLMGETAVTSYYIPIIIPSLNINVGGADNPGVQVCDFLLWAIQRKLAGREDKWVSWSKLQEKSNYNIGGDPLSGCSFFLYEKIPSELIFPFLSVSEEMDLDNNSFKDAVITIEKYLRNVSDVTIKNVVIQRDFDELLQNIDSEDFSIDDVQAMVRIFLLIADEIPFYDSENKQHINEIYFLKRVCSEVANKQYVKWLFRSKNWLEVRKDNFHTIKNT